MSSVEFTDNSDIFKGAKDEAVRRALEAIGQQAEGYAKKLCPVDTGLLRNSITHMASGETVSMSYHAEYGSNRNAQGKRYKATSKNAGTVGMGSVSDSVGKAGVQVEYIGTNVEYAAYV